MTEKSAKVCFHLPRGIPCSKSGICTHTLIECLESPLPQQQGTHQPHPQGLSTVNKSFECKPAAYLAVGSASSFIQAAPWSGDPNNSWAPKCLAEHVRSPFAPSNKHGEFGAVEPMSPTLHTSNSACVELGSSEIY